MARAHPALPAFTPLRLLILSSLQRCFARGSGSGSSHTNRHQP